MNIDDFFSEAHSLVLKSESTANNSQSAVLLSNEALFQLPFLAMVILMLSKGRRKPKSNELGQLVGECLEKTLMGFKGSSQHIGWSANLRIRTIKALSFLEISNLVTVDQDNKYINSTDLGKDVVEKATAGLGNLAITLQIIERNYRNIAVEKQIELELN